MANPTATWLICMYAECPKCRKEVDLLEAPDFWDGRKLDLGENLTERCKNVEVVCPECSHEFIVDIEY